MIPEPVVSSLRTASVSLPNCNGSTLKRIFGAVVKRSFQELPVEPGNFFSCREGDASSEWPRSEIIMVFSARLVMPAPRTIPEASCRHFPDDRDRLSMELDRVTIWTESHLDRVLLLSDFQGRCPWSISYRTGEKTVQDFKAIEAMITDSTRRCSQNPCQNLREPRGLL